MQQQYSRLPSHWCDFVVFHWIFLFYTSERYCSNLDYFFSFNSFVDIMYDFKWRSTSRTSESNKRIWTGRPRGPVGGKIFGVQVSSVQFVCAISIPTIIHILLFPRSDCHVSERRNQITDSACTEGPSFAQSDIGRLLESCHYGWYSLYEWLNNHMILQLIFFFCFSPFYLILHDDSYSVFCRREGRNSGIRARRFGGAYPCIIGPWVTTFRNSESTTR